jgi:hypothetical protein
MAQSVVIDDSRTEAIFASASLSLTKKQREIHRFADLWLASDEAVKVSLANDVREFSPPKGTQLFFLGPT